MSCCGLPRLWSRKRWPGSPSASDTSWIKETSDGQLKSVVGLYSPLKRYEIRLLTFKSLHKEAPMELQMQTVTLGARPYQALSYVWGSEAGLRQSIRVNDCALDITTNLCEALEAMRRLFRRSRQRASHTFFWIDAVCIDQSHSREKSQQVQLMGKIYSKAEDVLIWLGPADKDSNTALRFFQRWGGLLSGNQDLQAALRREGPRRDVSDRLSKSILRDVDRAGREGFLGLDRLHAVGRFSNRSYWGRTWTLQEQVLARRGAIMCGDRCVSASTFWSVGVVLFHLATMNHFPEAHVVAMVVNCFPCLPLRLGWVRGSEKARDLHLDALDACFGRPSMASEHLKGQGSFLHLILESCGKVKSTDPRDRIYGLLGLVADDQRPVQPDYDLDACQVYTRYWTAELKKADGVMILGLVATKIESKPIADLPSWVPDFRGGLQGYTEWHPHARRRRDDVAPSLRWSSDGRELTVRGYLFDQVEDVCDFYTRAKPSEQIWKCVEFILCHFLTDPYSIRQADCPWTVALFHAYVVGRRNNDVDAGLILSDEAIRDEVLLYFSILAEWTINSDLDRDTTVSFLLPPEAEAELDVHLLQPPNKRDEQDLLYRELLRQVAVALDLDPDMVDTFPTTGCLRESGYKLFARASSNWQDRHRLLLSRDGYIGSIEVDARKGDLICLVPECPQSLILRPTEDYGGGNRFKLVGRANFPFMSLQTEYLTDISDIGLV